MGWSGQGQTMTVLVPPIIKLSVLFRARESLRQEFVSYKLPKNYPMSRVKALLLGPVGSGKSCFVNSIRSTMYKRIVHLPNVGTAKNGFTKKVVEKSTRECHTVAIPNEINKQINKQAYMTPILYIITFIAMSWGSISGSLSALMHLLFP